MTQEMNSTPETNNSQETNSVVKQKIFPGNKKSSSPWQGLKVWWAVMIIYLSIFAYVGYIAFWPMDFNDPENTVKKYLTILKEYQAENGKKENDTLNLAMEELMKKAEESANDMQQLASQSFNIVLGAFLAFLSATVTMVFQRTGDNKEPTPPESA